MPRVRAIHTPRFGLAGLTLLLVLSLPSSARAQETATQAARAYREAHEASIVRDFAELLAMPNVASDSEGINRNAVYIRDQLAARGVASELLRVEGAPPIVLGELRVPGATRTLGIYVHYDGQPVDESRWTHAPWEPTLYSRLMQDGGREIPFPSDGDSVDPESVLYARSAGDDKAPIGALFPVLDAFQEHGIAPTSNLLFFFEGEEEAGSPRLARYLDEFSDRIQDVDVWLFFDGPIHQSGRPLLTYGVRGVTGMEVTVYGPARPLHSGHYGNWAPVPGQMLAHLLASMKSESGEVLVEGFYDTVDPLGEAELNALAEMPTFDEELKEELGLSWTEGEPQTLAERLLLPSLTIRGIESGNVGARARNVIPASATAALGVRLVKGNDPELMLDLVVAHIRRQGYHIVTEEPDQATRLEHRKVALVRRDGGYPAARTDMNIPIVRQVTAAARAAAGEQGLVLVPALGGSLPLYLFTEQLGKPAIVVPIANHDDNQHAADENLRIRNLWYGIDLYAALLSMPRDAPLP